MTTAGFAPGFKGGGPIRSLSNLAQALKGDFTVRIVTRDRDIGDKAPYPGLKLDAWLRWNSAAIAYCSGAVSLCRALRSAIRRDHATILYLNSYFHWLFSMWPLALDLIGVIRPTCIVVAPRGEFSPGALAIRSRRKRVFMQLAEMTGFHQRVVWHATTPDEVKDIRRALGDRHDLEIVVARNLTIVSPWTGEASSAGDCRERLKIVFLSRIAEKKNLLFVIKSLQIVKAAVELRIAGPIEDDAYWRVCQRELEALPKNVRVTVVGPVRSEDVRQELSKAHIFYLPTLGENYGHAIAEALLAGLPVLISDTTPWRNLKDHGAGWDLSLGDVRMFAAAIESAASLAPDQYEHQRRSARLYAESMVRAGAYEESVDMFRKCLSRAKSCPDRTR